MMTLTPEEILIAKSSTYFGEYWGKPGKGLCPAGLVAEYRGAKFDPDEDPSCETAIYKTRDSESYEIARQSAKDLAQHMGLHTSLEYYDILAIEGEAMLKRLDSPASKQISSSQELTS